MHRANQIELDQLFERLVSSRRLIDLIAAALAEDLQAAGDVTSTLSIDRASVSRAAIRARAGGCISGAKVAALVAKQRPGIDVAIDRADGSIVEPGGVIMRLRGPTRWVLEVERTLLNFLTHLSGIATLTRRFVNAVADTQAKVYDTRKTLPGYRALAKYAVRCGGGHCHRMGLHDAVLIKDNHMAAMGGRIDAVLKRIVAAAAERQPRPSFVEVEVDTLDQLEQVLGVDGVDIVLLDNMASEQLRAAVALRDDQAPGVQLEASGGVTLETAAAVAATGVDRIAIGALTHSAPALDLGLDFEPADP